MEIHSYNVIGASACEKVGNQGTRLSNPLAVSDLRLEGWRLRDGWLACQSTGYAGCLGATGAVDAVGSVISVEVRRLLAFCRVKRVATLDAIRFDRAGRVRSSAIALVQLYLAELLVQRRRAIRKTRALRLPWVGRLWTRVERVSASP